MRRNYWRTTDQGTSDVWIHKPVIVAIKEMARLSPRIETGGILMGTTSPSGRVVVTSATGPGPNAVRTAGKFVRDTEYCQAALNDAYAQHGWDYVGEWHSHVIPLMGPSTGDLHTLSRIVNDRDYGFGQFLMILAIVYQGTIRLRCYVATTSGVREATYRAYEDIAEIS